MQDEQTVVAPEVTEETPVVTEEQAAE